MKSFYDMLTYCIKGFLRKMRVYKTLSKLKLNCCHLGNPAPSVKWSKDGKELKSDDRLSFTAESGVCNMAIKVLFV